MHQIKFLEYSDAEKVFFYMTSLWQDFFVKAVSDTLVRSDMCLECLQIILAQQGLFVLKNSRIVNYLKLDVRLVG